MIPAFPSARLRGLLGALVALCQVGGYLPGSFSAVLTRLRWRCGVLDGRWMPGVSPGVLLLSLVARFRVAIVELTNNQVMIGRLRAILNNDRPSSLDFVVIEGFSFDNPWLSSHARVT